VKSTFSGDLWTEVKKEIREGERNITLSIAGGSLAEEISSQRGRRGIWGSASKESRMALGRLSTPQGAIHLYDAHEGGRT